MRHALRHLLLVALFLLAHAGALAHELGHSLDHAAPGGEPVCEQCLAYAPLGAAAASSPTVWHAPASIRAFYAPLPAASPTGFRPIYQSRAPPLR